MQPKHQRYSDCNVRQPTPTTIFEGLDWELTLRELLFSVLIAGVMFTIGFFIAGHIENSALASTLKYRQAAQISTTNEFMHALKTDIGLAFVEGKFMTIDPVSDSATDGKWLSIEKVKQHYTRHTQVYTTYDHKGRPHVHTRHYYSWDPVDSKFTHASVVNFCGKNFPYKTFNYCASKGTEDVVKIDSNNRYVFYKKYPVFDASIVAKLMHGSIPNGTLLNAGKSIEDLYEENTTNYNVVIFWIVWALFSLFVLAGFYYIDNDWLED